MKTKRLTKNKTKLKTGESQRNDGVFRYSWYDRFGKRHYLYSSSLPELRKKEDGTVFIDSLVSILFLF